LQGTGPNAQQILKDLPTTIQFDLEPPNFSVVTHVAGTCFQGSTALPSHVSGVSVHRNFFGLFTCPHLEQNSAW